MEPKGVVASSEPKWIRVEDGVPKNGQDVLAYVSSGEKSRIIVANYHRGYWFDSIMWFCFDDVTHWMPLPEPPKIERN